MQHARRAFTLIELALVLVIVSLMTGFGLQAFDGTAGVNCYQATQEQLQTIDKALQTYASTHQRLPKPARMDLGTTDSNFGVEATGGIPPAITPDLPAYGTQVPTGVQVSNGTLIGALPHATIGLPAQYAADCWGDKFTYAVTNTQTSSSDSPASGYRGDSIGTIQLKSGGGSTLSPNITYVVVSNGQDKFGGTPMQAANAGANNCNGSTASKLDKDNCNSDDQFTTSIQNTGNTGKYFDDLMVYSAKVQSRLDCPDQIYSWGGGCSTSTGSLTHEQSATLSSHTDTFSGSINIRCYDGHIENMGGASCFPSQPCNPTTVSWGAGCQHTFTAPIHDNTHNTSLPDEGPKANQVTGYYGTGYIHCNNGTPTVTGASCSAVTATCSGGAAHQWGPGNECSITNPSLSLGGSNGHMNQENTSSLYQGWTSVSCVQPDTSVNAVQFSYGHEDCHYEPRNCSAASLPYGGSCNINVGATTHNANTPTLSNTNAGHTGSAYAHCWNGNYDAVNGDCHTDCGGTSYSWSSGHCSGSYPTLHTGDSYTISNVSGGYTGSWTFQCSEGSMASPSGSCCVNDGNPTSGGSCCNADTDGNGTCGFQCRPDGASSGGNPSLCCNNDADGNGTCGTQAVACGGDQGYCDFGTCYVSCNNVCGSCPNAGHGLQALSMGVGCDGSLCPVPCNADGVNAGGNPAGCCNGDTDGNGTCGFQCRANGASSSGNPALCCNGDPDSNGVCGTQATCAAGWSKIYHYSDEASYDCRSYDNTVGLCTSGEGGSSPSSTGRTTTCIDPGSCVDARKCGCDPNGSPVPNEGYGPQPQLCCSGDPDGNGVCGSQTIPCTGDGSPPGGGGCCNGDPDGNGVCGNQTPVVNGVCSGTTGSCTAGTLSGAVLCNNSCPNHCTWSCAGSGGGSTASCSNDTACTLPCTTDGNGYADPSECCNPDTDGNNLCGTQGGGGCSPAQQADIDAICPYDSSSGTTDGWLQYNSGCQPCGSGAVATCESHSTHSEYGLWEEDSDTWYTVATAGATAPPPLPGYYNSQECQHHFTSSTYPGGYHDDYTGQCPYSGPTCVAAGAAACGSANGGSTVAAPSGGSLCNAGSPTAVTGSGPWSWSCVGSNTINCGSNRSCAANTYGTWDTNCRSRNMPEEPHNWAGTENNVAGGYTGNAYIYCDQGTWNYFTSGTHSCTPAATPIDGQCGSGCGSQCDVGVMTENGDSNCYHGTIASSYTCHGINGGQDAWCAPNCCGSCNSCT